MDLEKFNWNKANHAKWFDTKTIAASDAPRELVVHDATAEDTQKAYNALVNHGKVSDFKVEVWNDIIGKIYDIAEVLDPKDVIRRFKSTVIGMSTSDRQKWIDYAHEHFPQLDTEEEIEEWLGLMWDRYKPGVMRKLNYNNAAHNCLPDMFGSLPVVNSGDDLKGEYILALVDVINKWIDINPIPGIIFLDAVLDGNVHILIPVCTPLDLKTLSSIHNADIRFLMIQSTQARIRIDFKLLMESLRIAQLRSLPFSSVINFMMLKMSVNVLDKWPIYFYINAAYRHHADVKITKLLRLVFGFTDMYRYLCNVNCIYSGSLSFRVKPLSGKTVIQVLPDTSSSFPFALSVYVNHANVQARVRTRRPMPLSIVDEYRSGSRVRVEHEGIETVEHVPETVGFSDEVTLQQASSKNLEKTDVLSLVERQVELCENRSFHMEHTDRLNINGTEQLNVASVQYIDHKGQTKLEGDTSFDASFPVPYIVDNRTLKTRDFFEVGFANEQSFKAKDGKLKTTNESITLDYSPQIDLLHDGVFDTRETMFLEHTYGIGMEADVTFTSISSSKIESNRTKELEGESVISSVYLAELLFGLNAYLESEINGFITAYEASMYKYHIQGIAGVEQFIRTLDTSSLSKVMDKVIAGESITCTDIKSILLARLMRFLVSNQNVTTVALDAQGTAAHPRIMNPKAIPVESSLNVFLDASYVGGDEVLEADGRVGFDLDVDPIIIPPAESFKSAVQVGQASEVTLDETLSKRQEGTAISSSASEASCTLARVSLTWAIDLEDVLACEKENIKVNEVERTLYF